MGEIKRKTIIKSYTKECFLKLPKFNVTIVKLVNAKIIIITIVIITIIIINQCLSLLTSCKFHLFFIIIYYVILSELKAFFCCYSISFLLCIVHSFFLSLYYIIVMYIIIIQYNNKRFK